MAFFEFNQKFPTEEAAIDHFYRIRYNGVLACPHCGAEVKLYRTARRKVCVCHSCNNTFSPFADAIFRKSKIDMRKWLCAIRLLLNGGKGVSGCQLQRDIEATCKIALRMLQ
jgi:transposase-like protein